MNDPRITLPLARLAADPERKQTRNGTPYLLIRVAATGGHVDKTTKQWVDHDTMWATIFEYDVRLAETYERMLRKGTPVRVDGVLKWKTGTDNHGQPRTDFVKERPWRDHVRDTILSHRTPTIPVNSYVTVETTFYLPRPKTIPTSKRKHPTVKPDIDKLQRALYDAITETHIWHDDCQITDVTSHKRYADDTPTGVFLTITWEPNQ